jgi:hypothetical protein
MDMKTIFRKTGTITAAAFSIALMGASAASAATFDFRAMADYGNLLTGDPNYIGGTELNWQDTAFAGGLTIGGITLIASGSNANSVNGAFADAFFDKGNAGLGVCSTPDTASGDSGCASGLGPNPWDDNVSGYGGGETLTLAFNKVVDFTSLTFRNYNHTAGMTGVLELVGFGQLTVTNGVVTTGAEGLSGSNTYRFKYLFGTDTASNNANEFYISAASVSAVPLPAGMVLLLTGFGALGVARRRKTAAAA